MQKHLMSLPENVIESIQRLKKFYFEFRESERGQDFEKERRERMKNVKRVLTNLEGLDESSLLVLANNLYAFGWWANKEWLVDYWKKNTGGIDKLRNHLKDLLSSDRGLADRVELFRKNVKGIGAAMFTEMLAYYNPQEYGIWNKAVKKAFLKLGITKLSEFFDVSKIGISKLSGKEYVAILNTLKEIAKHLREPKKLPQPDLLDVDYFLYYIVSLHYESNHEPDEGDYDPDEVVETLLKLGRGLGFDASSEVFLTTGTRVDAVWTAKIGNLGELKYVFEVHIKGSIDSLVLNLIKASQDPAVQKVVAVTYGKELEKIRKEVEPLKLDKLLYWDVREVDKACELIEKLMDIMQGLGLTRLNF